MSIPNSVSIHLTRRSQARTPEEALAALTEAPATAWRARKTGVGSFGWSFRGGEFSAVQAVQGFRGGFCEGVVDIEGCSELPTKAKRSHMLLSR